MAVENTKPIIVMVHGAFHPQHYYRHCIALLRGRGHTVLAPPMPTTGLDDSINGTTYTDDVAAIHRVLVPRLDAGEEAVLVCHSQGGIAGSAATEGQTVAERSARGLKGGIRAVVYVAAFALPERGLSLLAAIGSKEDGELPPIYSAEGAHLIPTPLAATGFYNQLDEAKQTTFCAGLSHQSLASIKASVHFSAVDVQCPKTYIVCTEDQAIPPVAQRAWASASACRVVELESDHSPFLHELMLQRVVYIITEAAEMSDGMRERIGRI